MSTKLLFYRGRIELVMLRLTHQAAKEAQSSCVPRVLQWQILQGRFKKLEN